MIIEANATAHDGGTRRIREVGYRMAHMPRTRRHGAAPPHNLMFVSLKTLIFVFISVSVFVSVSISISVSTKHTRGGAPSANLEVLFLWAEIVSSA